MRGNNSFLLKIAINLFFLYSIINCLLVWSGHTYSLTFSISKLPKLVSFQNWRID